MDISQPLQEYILCNTIIFNTYKFTKIKMPLHQSERFIKFENPRRIKNEKLAEIFNSENLVDPNGKRKTVYFVNSNMHVHILNSQPLENN